jgi:adenylate cyclase
MLVDWRRAVILAVIALAGAGAAVVLGRLAPVLALERLTQDLRIARLAPPRPQDERVVLLAIGEDTLAALPYRSPIHRGLLAELLETLAARRVAAVGLDVLLDQPTEPELDRRLRATLARMPVPTVVVRAGAAIPLTERQRRWHEAFLAGLEVGDGTLLSDPLDGVVRRQRPVGPGEGEAASFAGAIARRLGAALPAGTLPIDFRRGPDAATPPFRVFPAEAAGLLPAAWLEAKVVLVGPVLQAIDRHPTPLSRAVGGEETPGVLIHAHALAQLLEGTRVKLPGAGEEALALVLAAALAVGLVALRLPWPVEAAGGTLLLAGWWLGAFALATRGGALHPVVGPTLAMAFAGFAATAWLGRRERAERRFIRKAFEQYLAPTMVRRLARDPSALRLGGERREITCLFTDLEGFTSLTERLPPETLVALLNEYMDGVLAIVLAHEGTVDKLVGDAVHAFWGAPEPQADHAPRALAAALAIDRFAEAWRARQTVGRVGVTRIGVHGGPAIVGNFGGRRRFDYTPMGDVVNTAARLESVNKQFGTRVCISEAVARACPDQPVRPIGDLVLVGKQAALRAFEPVPDPAYAAAFRLLEEDDAGALAAFERLAAANPADPLARFHRDRLRRGERGVRIVLERK